MEKFIVKGKTVLNGEVKIGGAKNSALAIIPACLLIDGVTTLDNVPNISDIVFICDILESLGVSVKWKNTNTLIIDTHKINTTKCPIDMTSKFRASYYLLGSLLGRCNSAEVGLPGGCNIGSRPIDQHIKGFEALGANIDIGYGKISATTKKLNGTSIYFDVTSVGATINNILASVLANGETSLYNVAKEPHVVDVANFLNSAGADISGAGTDSIRIRGVENLSGNHSYSIVPDQIEAGTFMVAAIATHGNILIKDCVPEHLDVLSAKIEEMGGMVESFTDSIRVSYQGKINATNIKTLPYPGFPTDMQPQFGVALSIADGTSIITESIWDSRFSYTDELAKMGAQITAKGQTAVIEGVKNLSSAHLYATDLRAGAALLIAGMIADGKSEIYNIHYIDRGYEKIEDKFNQLGAKIERVEYEEE